MRKIFLTCAVLILLVSCKKTNHSKPGSGIVGYKYRSITAIPDYKYNVRDLEFATDTTIRITEQTWSLTDTITYDPWVFGYRFNQETKLASVIEEDTAINIFSYFIVEEDSLYGFQVYENDTVWGKPYWRF